jgi:hypothetical protein
MPSIGEILSVVFAPDLFASASRRRLRSRR